MRAEKSWLVLLISNLRKQKVGKILLKMHILKTDFKHKLLCLRIRIYTSNTVLLVPSFTSMCSRFTVSSSTRVMNFEFKFLPMGSINKRE